jgi:RNA ligase
MKPEQIQPLIAAGRVKAERHPAAPLTIFNYTAACQFERAWCPVSRACRGLILHDGGRTIARPFPKFHNLDEHTPDEEAFSKPFVVTEKLDGSLGVLYAAPDGPAIATRGSFVSTQAREATRMLRERYPHFAPDPSLTYLFEILFPENRVVVDYGPRRELVLLAVIDTASGRDVDDACGWPGPIARRYDAACRPRDVLAALNLTDDGNAEGVVLRFDWPKTGPQFRVKVKLAEYVRLHRLFFGLSSKGVWEALSEGRSLDEVAERVPDEFHGWLRATIADLTGRYEAEEVAALAEFAALRAGLPPDVDRRTFALEAVKSPRRALLFKLLDGHPIRELIWKDLRPMHARPFRSQPEDVA